jgi:hypothetical protein
MPLPPKAPSEWDWEKCEKLLTDPQLFRVLNVRLIWLAMNTESAVATRSIEMLHEYGQEESLDSLGDVSTETLEAARTKAIALIHSMNGDERQAEDV